MSGVAIQPDNYRLGLLPDVAPLDLLLFARPL